MANVQRRQAPAFKGASSLGHEVNLSDYRGAYLVLYFYPKSFTVGCTRETIAFRDATDELRALGAEIVGVSRDPEDVQCKFAQHYQASFAIVADVDGKITRDYDVVFPIIGRSQRVTFVIDPEGVIVARFHHELLFDKHITDALAFMKSVARRA